VVAQWVWLTQSGAVWRSQCGSSAYSAHVANRLGAPLWPQWPGHGQRLRGNICCLENGWLILFYSDKHGSWLQMRHHAVDVFELPNCKLQNGTTVLTLCHVVMIRKAGPVQLNACTAGSCEPHTCLCQ
jgi:hypothetical protein